MAFFPVPVEEFPGLNLINDPGEVGFSGAIDLSNISFDHDGRVRSRDGYSAIRTSACGGNGLYTFFNQGTTPLYLSGDATHVYVVNNDGTGSVPTVAAGGVSDATAMGTSVGSFVYFVDSNNHISYYDVGTASFTIFPGLRPDAVALTSTPWDNRLVAANFTDRSQLWFSNAGNATQWGENPIGATGVAGTGVFTATSHGYSVGDAVVFNPTSGGSGITKTRLYYVTTVPSANTFTVSTGKGGSTFTFATDMAAGSVHRNNDYIDLYPNDGEVITGLATWENLVFAFKQRKFFVFYGTSDDSTGNAIFNYRTVDTGISAVGTKMNAIASSPEGLFFVGQDGIYITTGAAPKKVSRAIDPLFRGSGMSAFWTGITKITGVTGMAYFNDRLYTSVNDGTNYAVLVYNTTDGSWSYWSLANPANGLATGATAAGVPTLCFGGGSSANRIYRFDPAATDDAGTAIAARYASGFENLAPPRRYVDRYGFGPSRKRIRSWRISGSGTVTMSVAADQGDFVGATPLTLGTAPAVKETRYNRAVRGAKIAYKLAGTAPWSVSGLIANLADTRAVGSDISGDV